jgi:hypothetical protein
MQEFMPHHSHTAIFTTVSGVVGGVGKAVIAKPLLLVIFLHGITTVVLDAAASANAGYVIMKFLVNFLAKLNKYNKENINKVVGIAFGIGLRKELVNLLKCRMFRQFSII